MQRAPRWSTRAAGAVMVIVGFVSLFVYGWRGHSAVSRWSAPLVVDRGRVWMDVDRCVERTIKRLVPRGAEVWPVPGPSYYWSNSIGYMAGPDRRFVKTPHAGVYWMRVVNDSPSAGDGVKCSARSPRVVLTVVVQVRQQ